MTNNVVRRVVGVVAKLGLAAAVVGALVFGQQSVARAAQTTIFQLPLVKITQTSGVPTQLSIYLTATVGDNPGVTTFGVADSGPFGGSTALDSHARIQWVNLTTGASGVADVADRETAQPPCGCAPVPVSTGAGRIIALATAGGLGITVSSGFGTFTAV